MIDVRRLFGRNVTGTLAEEAVARMRTEAEVTEMAPLTKKFALCVLDGLTIEESWRRVLRTGSTMRLTTAGWYVSRAYAALREVFGYRWEEFGLSSRLNVDADMTTSELAHMLGIAPCTLRGKIEKAEAMGLPLPKRMMGRTLRRGQYIFPKAVAVAWAAAYVEGRL